MFLYRLFAVVCLSLVSAYSEGWAAGEAGPRAGGVAGRMTLVGPGVTPRIFVGAGATESEKFAADELSAYLEKMSGRSVAVHSGETVPTPGAGAPLILIGHQPANADLHPERMGVEESVVSVEPGRVRIVGGAAVPVVAVAGNTAKPVRTTYVQDRGTLYGVYSLLDELGVRWYRPEPWGEYVPTTVKIDLPLGKTTFKPAYKYRYGLGNYQDKAAQTPEQTEWMSRWLVRNRMSVGQARYGGAYRTAFQHNYQYLVPHAQYFKAHPEYFALIGGVRSENPRAQLCLSNPEVQELVAEKTIAQARQNPQQSVFSLDPNDRTLWCECAQCKAMDDPALLTPAGKVSMANRVAAFNNIVARKLAAAMPGAKVGWRAYAMHTETPTIVTTFEPNTAVEATAFAGTYSDYSRRLLDARSKQNAAFVKVLRGYGTRTELLVHDYYSGYAWYGPLPVLSTMKDRFSHYRDFKVQGVSTEAHPSWGPQGIAHYFFARLLWDPDLDLDQELAAYCRNYYGPAAAPMLAYHRLLDGAAQQGPRFGSGGSYLAALFNDGLIAKMTPLMVQARAAAAGREPFARRVEGDWAGYEVARLVAVARGAKRRQQPEQALAAIEQMKSLVLSYKDGSVFDNSPAIFKYVTGAMLTTSALDAVGKQDGALKAYTETRLLQPLDDGWRIEGDARGDGLARGVAKPDFDDARWQPATATQPWQEQGFPHFAGVMWYRRKLTVPAMEAKQRVLLAFGAADGDAVVYLNGVKAGEHLLGVDNGGWNQPFVVDITAALRAGAKNTIAVSVTKKDGNGGIYQGVDLWQGVPQAGSSPAGAPQAVWQDF